ncbi:MAG: competence/damage-inducible protein A [Lewinellaceae bacterium]|nr:competence/damage-inducible protein A [Lewinellaceae bacterium]
MQAGIITIGDEILLGQVVDTNSAWMGQQLASIGVSVQGKWSVGDDLSAIKGALQQAVQNCDIVFITGGLGPTKDDITKIALADFLGVDMYFDQATYDRIVAIFKKLYKPLSESHRVQCMLPQGAKLLHNSQGTAPGMWFEHEKKHIISMPGVPSEMKAIMTEEVLPKLEESSSLTILHRTLLTSCMSETVIEDKIQPYIKELPPYVSIAYLPSLAQVRVRVTIVKDKQDFHAQAELDTIVENIMKIIGNDVVYGMEDATLSSVIKHLCVNKGISIATAESCTGGGIAANLVSTPGSSDYFLGSVVAYRNEIKQQILKVNEDILSHYGAVSKETVEAMVMGIRNLTHADIGVAVSGIAGPSGGTPEKPVGSIWVAIGNASTMESYFIKGYLERQKNIDYTIIFALSKLREFILRHYVDERSAS